MVQWDYKGEKGYGHIIEGIEDAAGRGEGEEGMGGPIDEGDRGGGKFPAYVTLIEAENAMENADTVQVLCSGDHWEHVGVGTSEMA